MGSRIDEIIPIVDFKPLSGKYETLSRSAFEKVALEFGSAMTSVGFAYVKNHEVDIKKIDHIHELSKEFFSLPTKVKNKYRKTNPPECFHGYAGPGDELLNETQKNSTELREFFDIWGFEQYEDKHFPSEVPSYKAAFDSVRPECHQLAKKLLRCLGIFLKLEDEEFFIKAHKFLDDPSIQTQSQFRTLHYSPLEPSDEGIPPNAIRCGEHADWGTITALFQDMVGGLEVKRLDGTWMEATPIEGTVLVNAAQLLELWSAGIFKAAPHRVRIVDEERIRKTARQSFVFFINPDGPYIVKPIVDFPPGEEKYRNRKPLEAYSHYKRLIADATKHY